MDRDRMIRIIVRGLKGKARFEQIMWLLSGGPDRIYQQYKISMYFIKKSKKAA